MISRFTIFGVTTIVVLLVIGTWLFFAIQAAQADRIEVRAISATMHNRCAAMPRGDQFMEEKRHECFKQLYRTPWTRTD
jgi:hypothetical protein